jgi:hypothetical protein
MECTKCHKLLSIDNFSYKNVEKKIYYLHCDKCREKQKQQVNKKADEKQQYEKVKNTNVVHCECGSKYIAFRVYHIARHKNSLIHLSYIRNIQDVSLNA